MLFQRASGEVQGAILRDKEGVMLWIFTIDLDISSSVLVLTWPLKRVNSPLVICQRKDLLLNIYNPVTSRAFLFNLNCRSYWWGYFSHNILSVGIWIKTLSSETPLYSLLSYPGDSTHTTNSSQVWVSASFRIKFICEISKQSIWEKEIVILT